MTQRIATTRFLVMLACCILAQCHLSACGGDLDDLIDDVDKRDHTDLTPTIEWGDEYSDDAGCESDAGTDGGCGDAGGDP
jgi:hypothetical protein